MMNLKRLWLIFFVIFSLVDSSYSATIKAPINNHTQLLNIGTKTHAQIDTHISVTINAKEYGAVGDGVTDDTTAIQNAINALTYGGKVYLGSGTFKITTLNVLTGVLLEGSGRQATTLNSTSSSSDIITLAAASGIVNLKVSASVTRTAGVNVNMNGDKSIIDSCDIINYYIGVKAGDIPSSSVTTPTIINSLFYNGVIAAGSGGINYENVYNGIIDNTLLSGPISGTQPDWGIRIQQVDTILISNVNVTLHGKGLLINPSTGYSAFAVSVINSLFDSAGTISGGTTVSSAEISPAGGAVYDTKFSNTWFGLSTVQQGMNLLPSGAGVIDGVTFTGCEFVDNGDNGLIAVGTSVTNVVVTGGFSAGNINKGIRMASGNSYFSITGHVAGNVAGRGANDYGINIDAGASNYYVISDNILSGNTSASMYDGGTGTSKYVTSNVGYNPISPSITVGSSPYTWTNNTGSTCNIIISGGTLTQVALNGTVIPVSLTVLPVIQGGTLQVSYSSVPTMSGKCN